MSNGDDTLIDKNGVIYKKGWDGLYHPVWGSFGPKRDTTWTGQPNVQRDWLGRPQEATDWLGMPVRSISGETLYRRAGSSGSSGWGGGGGDAAAAALSLLLGIGLLVLLVYAISALLGLMVQILAALFSGWRYLVKRYPRTMLIVHLLLGMTAVGSGLYLAGFDSAIQLAGIALVPALWGWLWLTRRLPMIFMPINAALLGGGLSLAAQLTRPTWLLTWSRLTAGIPLVNNLPLLLAAIPMLLWLWVLGARRWPQIFRPLNLLVLGAISCFFLLRVWTDWQPLWEAWMAPVPLLPQVTGWLIFLLPLGIWLWHNGQVRWPMPFTALNLLVFGGLMGLTAYHTQSSWLIAWRNWMAGLPFAAAPILTISLSPVTLWGWSWASRRWRKVFVIPNLLLSGGILWLILDRTRPLWASAWQTVWGEVPLTLDPALLVLVSPLAVWVWKQGSQRWPHYWGIARALLWGGILWWGAERTRTDWYGEWKTFAGQEVPDPTLLIGLMPLLIWGWWHLRRRWPRLLRTMTWTVIALVSAWIVRRLLPASTPILWATIGLLPLGTGGWMWLLRRHPRVGWPLTLLPLIGLSLLAWLAPDHLQALLSVFVKWLATQGLSIGWE